MGVLTIEGIYKDRKVELSERPEGVGEVAPVLVIFLLAQSYGPAKAGPTPEEIP